MRGVTFLGERKLELAEFPDPAPSPADVVIEIKASAMCGRRAPDAGRHFKGVPQQDETS